MKRVNDAFDETSAHEALADIRVWRQLGDAVDLTLPGAVITLAPIFHAALFKQFTFLADLL